MILESETAEALRRAGKRAAYHLAMAGIEGLKALSAVLDELARVGQEDSPDELRQRINVE
ncbi:MAG: hypothetical protein ACR2ME_07290 [Acidimicrobiia bacterium]